MTEGQITALIDNKRVIGPGKDVKEVLNAIKVYENMDNYDPVSSKSFLSAHQQLMEGLIDRPGQYRTENVGIIQGSKVAHLAPPAGNVHFLMSELFEYLKNEDDPTLIKSCVFHYEMEFIHPFVDGNGRMGRLWQTIILMQEYPVFEYLPFESLISQTQEKYYEALSKSDKAGKSTVFIEYMLKVIDESLGQLLNFNNRTLSAEDRLEYFVSFHKKEFTRNDYMNIFKSLSTATASRDLRKGVELGFFIKTGEKRKTIYKLGK